VSLERALSLLRGGRRRDETDPTETARAEAAANDAERSVPPVGDPVTPPARGTEPSTTSPRSPALPSSPLPQSTDDERTWLRKFRGMQAGGGMASVIHDSDRLRNPDAGDSRAFVRDSFNPWR
jgi:hypothetical protein